MSAVTELTAARTLLAHYGEAAWLLTDPALPALHGGPALYLCDVGSGRTLILETAAGALQQLSAQAGMDETAYERVAAALNVLIDDLLSSSQGLHPDTRRGIILGAALCIAETRGFHLTRHHGADVQYVLLRYTGEGQRAVLTPMPVFKAHPITAAELDSTVTHLLSSEQLNFPGHFLNGRPLRFKEVRRHFLAGRA